MSELHAAFCKHLTGLDRAALAVLRRSLAFEPPGSFTPAFRYVEPLAAGPGISRSSRTAMYLVAGLYALVARRVSTAERTQDGSHTPAQEDSAPSSDGGERADGPIGGKRSVPRSRDNLGGTLGRLFRRREANLKGSGQSIERRFVVLLDADEGQLPHRLRQMVALLASEDDVTVDWPQLLDDLADWNRERRYVQQRWARAFYAPRPNQAVHDTKRTGERETA